MDKIKKTIDRETAKSYVIFGIKSTKFSPKMCKAFLPFSLIFSFIAIALFHNKIFIIINTFYVAANLFNAIFFKMKWSAFVGLLAQGTMLLSFAIGMNLVCFAMLKTSDLFVLVEYIISIVIQAVAFLSAIFLSINSAKKHNKDKKPMVNTIAGSVAGFVFVVVSVLTKVFLIDISLNTVIVILSVLINTVIIIVNFGIAMAYYRAYLIKKFSLRIEQEEMS